MIVDPLGLSISVVGLVLAVLLPARYGLLAVLAVQQMPWGDEVLTAGSVAIRPVDLVLLVWLIKLRPLLTTVLRDRSVMRTPAIRLWAVWMGWLLIATLSAHWREATLHGGAQLISLVRLYEMALLMPVGAMVVSVLAPAHARRLALAIAAMALVQVVLALTRWAPMALLNVDWLTYLDIRPDHPWFFGRDPILSYPISRYGRWTGSFGDPATFSYFALIGLSAVWATLRRSESRRSCLMAGGALLVTGVLGSVTRTAWIGLLALAAAGWLLAGTARPAGPARRRWTTVLGGGLAAWLMLIAAQQAPAWLAANDPAPVTGALPTEPPPVGEPPEFDPEAVTAPLPARPPEDPTGLLSADADLRDRLRLRVDESSFGRVEMMRLSLEVLRAHPAVGVGWSGRRFHVDAEPWGETLWTRLLAETGIPGLLLFLAFTGASLLAAYRTARRFPAPEIIGQLFGGMGLLTMSALLLADLLIVGPSITNSLFFFLAGSAAARPFQPSARAPGTAL